MDPDEQVNRTARFDRAELVIWVGLWANAFLMAMKLLAGWFGKSEAVFADGLESLCDFFAITSAMVALKVGRKRFDTGHPYGHGKAESISAILVALVILVTGVGIAWKAIYSMMSHALETPSVVAVIAAAVTILIKEGLCRYTLRVAGRLQSPTVEAVAKDHRKDALTSIATLVGVTGAFLGFRLMDPLAAGVSALFIVRIGWQTLYPAIGDLMDASLPPELLTEMSGSAARVEGVAGIHEIRGRRSGQYWIVDLKLEMDATMTVKQSHDIATRVKSQLFVNYPNIGDVMIHINPHAEEHEDLTRL
jgi:cation diffusion facilitator family transporter